jgi:transposase
MDFDLKETDMGQIGAALEPHREELAGAVIESTYNWYWLVDGLMDAGYRVHLAHPSTIKKYEGLKYSGDVADARYRRCCCVRTR